MVFALMLMAALYREDEQECRIGVYEEAAEAIEETLRARQRMIQSLQDRFPDDGSIAVDTTGTVRFAGNLLFSQGSDSVSEPGARALTDFAREYFPLLMEDGNFRDQLRHIVVEGHTNDDGNYEVNLDLSHARSLAVMLVLLEATDGADRDELEALVTANGRSFADLLCLPDGQPCPDTAGQQVDKARSRRIEIRFQMNDQLIVQRVLELGRILLDQEERCQT